MFGENENLTGSAFATVISKMKLIRAKEIGMTKSPFLNAIDFLSENG